MSLVGLAIGFGVAYPYADNVDLWDGPVWRFTQAGWLACLGLLAGHHS